ncbi:hypothetical protein BQ8794_40002 [Mesorhizobium prunaredense]|uniref:DUF1304 domain-containing protein n=1 Tax=Mesorhizobium prunaredense TaxID=1631249 RepID=A0A1R3VBW9_9HYPH|nr:hypothetical protein BQ8794_40002 [Mesorhizobium prunaredense]
MVAGQDARRNGSCGNAGVRDQYREAAPCRNGRRSMIANVLVGLVALIHLYIVYLEMVLWDTLRGHKASSDAGIRQRIESACRQPGALQRLSRGRADLGALPRRGRFPDQGVFPALRRHRRPLRRGDGRQENPLHPDRARCSCSGRARFEPVIRRRGP